MTGPTLPVAGGCRVVTHRSYQLRTLTVHSDALVVVLRGTKHLTAPDTWLTIHPGHCVMLASHSRWDVTNDPHGQLRYEALALQFEPEWVQALPNHEWPKPPHSVRLAHAFRTDPTLLQAVERTLDGSLPPPLLRHRMQEVLLLLAERGWTFPARVERSWSDRIRSVVAHQPEADWSVARLAALFHTSESTLRRRLRESEVPLAALVRETRLEAALGMLQTTALSIGDIAHRCGWDSHSRFSAAFQARWGVSPRDMRSLPADALEPTENAQAATESG